MNKINNFFFRLTIKNWGLPYHFIIAQFLTVGLHLIFTRLWMIPGPSKYIIIGLAVFMLGYLYEAYQKRKGENNKYDFITDTLANIAGILTGMIYICLL